MPEEPLPPLDEVLGALGAARVAELIKSEPHIAREVFRGVRAKAESLSLPLTRAALERMLEQDIPFRDKVQSAYEDWRVHPSEETPPEPPVSPPASPPKREARGAGAPDDKRRDAIRELRQSVAEWKSRASESARRAEEAEAASAREASQRAEAEDRLARAEASVTAARDLAREEAGSREAAEAEARRLAAEVERLHTELAHAHAGAGPAPLPLDTPADRTFALEHLRRLVDTEPGDAARALGRRLLAADPIDRESFALYARACAGAERLGELDRWCAHRARAATDEGDPLTGVDLLLGGLAVGGMELALCRGELARAIERVGRGEPRVRALAAELLGTAGGQAGEAVAAAAELVRERNPFVDLQALGLRPHLPGAASAFVPELSREVAASEVVRAIDHGDAGFVEALRRSGAKGLQERLAATDPYYAAVASMRPRGGVVVDASNVARAGEGPAEMALLLDLLATLRQARAFPIILVGDANLPHLIDDRDEWASLEGRGLAIRSEPGHAADEAIVKLAVERNLVVVSNDTGLAGASPQPRLRRVGFRLVEGTVVLDSDIWGGTA